jgi:hypothetical protein
MRTQRFERKIDILTRDNDEKFVFVGNVKRIEPKNFACTLHFLADRMEASWGSIPILAVCANSISALVTPLRCPITQNMDDRS